MTAAAGVARGEGVARDVVAELRRRSTELRRRDLQMVVDAGNGHVATDVSALGAAYLAGLALGTWTSLDDVESLPKSLERFEPRITDAARESARAAWRGAVARRLYEPDGGRHG